MQLGCGSCANDVVNVGQILLNPVTWTVALAAVLTFVDKRKKKDTSK